MLKQRACKGHTTRGKLRLSPPELPPTLQPVRQTSRIGGSRGGAGVQTKTSTYEILVQGVQTKVGNSGQQVGSYDIALAMPEDDPTLRSTSGATGSCFLDHFLDGIEQFVAAVTVTILSSPRSLRFRHTGRNAHPALPKRFAAGTMSSLGN